MLTTFILNRMQIKYLYDHYIGRVIRFERIDLYHYEAVLHFNTKTTLEQAVRVIYGNHPNAKLKVTIMNTDLQ